MICENCLGFDILYILFCEWYRNGLDKSFYIFLDVWDKFCFDEDFFEFSFGYYDVFFLVGDSVYGLVICVFWGQRVVCDIIEIDIGWMNCFIFIGIWLGMFKYLLWKMINDLIVIDSFYKVGLFVNFIFNCYRERIIYEEEDFVMLDFFFDKGLSDLIYFGVSINRSCDV